MSETNVDKWRVDRVNECGEGRYLWRLARAGEVLIDPAVFASSFGEAATLAQQECDKRNDELDAEVPPDGFVKATVPTILDHQNPDDERKWFLAWDDDNGYSSLEASALLPVGTMWLAFAPSKREEDLERKYKGACMRIAELENKTNCLETEERLRAIAMRENSDLRDKVKALEAERDELKRGLADLGWLEVLELRKVVKQLEAKIVDLSNDNANPGEPAPSNGVEWEEDKEGWFWWVERGKKMAVRHNGKWSWVSERTDSSSTEDVRVRPKGWRP